MPTNRNFILSALFFILVPPLLIGCAGPRLNLFSLGTEPLQEFVLQGDGDQKILVIQIKGIIWDKRKDGLLLSGPSMLQEIVSQLHKAEKDPDIKALVLKIDSPGGTVTASDIIYHELMEYKKKTGVTVIAAMMGLATSGGYYVALPADYIVAHPTTVTGSVGVLFPRWQAHGLLEKIGVRQDVSKSGKLKDMGSPFRNPTDEEVRLFQELVDGLSRRFISLVREHRNLTPKMLEQVSTARVFLAQEAADLGLIDQVGYLDDALTQARNRARLPQDAQVIIYRRIEQPDDNLYNTATSRYQGKPITLMELGLPGGSLPHLENRFYYLWSPGIGE